MAIVGDSRIHALTAQSLSDIFHHSFWWPNGEAGIYRPLTTLSFLLNYSILGNGTRPAGYHAVNLAIHLLAGGVVYTLGLAWAYRSGRVLNVGELETLPESPADVEMLAPTIESLPEDL